MVGRWRASTQSCGYAVGIGQLIHSKNAPVTLRARYAPGAQLTEIDGLSCDYATWRFNVRLSNTEPLVRLNVETRADPQLLDEKTNELLALFAAFGATA